MIHTVIWHNFHGHHSIKIRAEDGAELSESQMRKLSRESCGMIDCSCGGGYGDGYAPGSSRVLYGQIFSEKLYAELPV